MPASIRTQASAGALDDQKGPLTQDCRPSNLLRVYGFFFMDATAIFLEVCWAMRVFLSTVVRGAPMEKAGELISLDWEKKKVLKRLPIFPSNPSLDDPNARG